MGVTTWPPIGAAARLSGIATGSTSVATGVDFRVVFATSDFSDPQIVPDATLSWFVITNPGTYEASACAAYAAATAAASRHQLGVWLHPAGATPTLANTIERPASTAGSPASGERCPVTVTGLVRTTVPGQILAAWLYQSSGVAVTLDNSFNEFHFGVRRIA